MVDGAPIAGSVLTVSHWPRTPTPAELRADLSAESALLLCGRPEHWPDGVTAVTADHADVDGVVALALLAVPGLAETAGELLVEVARVGDFAVVRDRRAAEVAFAVAEALDWQRPAVPVRPDPSVGGCGSRAGRPPGLLGAQLRAGIGLLQTAVEEPGSLGGRGAAEVASFDRSCAAIAAGEVTVEEEPTIDLAVVRPEAGRWPEGAGWAGHVVHPAAVHAVSDCLRVATVGPDGVRLRFRYETWVRLRRPPRQLRVDLSRLAAALTEADATSWSFDGAAALRPELRPDVPDASRLDPEEVLAACRRELEALAGTVAFDPYR
jgi:hypothetical protein